MKVSNLNTPLQEIIEKALIAIYNHPYHDLNPGYRQAIWAALEVSTSATKHVEEIGRKRRLLLAILSAKKVLPLWEQRFPDDETPYRLLAKVERTLYENVESLEDDLETFSIYMANIEYQPVVMAGESAVAVLSIALWDEIFDPLHIDYNLTNTDLDPDCLDPALLASCAYANGGSWETGSDPKKRREFWEWWLLEAVPRAWSAF